MVIDIEFGTSYYLSPTWGKCFHANNALLQPGITSVVRDEEIIFPTSEYYTYSTNHLVSTYYV